MKQNRLLDVFLSASSSKTVRKETASTLPRAEEMRASPRRPIPIPFPVPGKRSGLPLKEPISLKRLENSGGKDTYSKCTEGLRKLLNYPNIVYPIPEKSEMTVGETGPEMKIVADYFPPTIIPPVVNLVETQLREVIEISSDDTESAPETLYPEPPSPVETRQTTTYTSLENSTYPQLGDPSSVPDEWAEYRKLHVDSFKLHVSADVPTPQPTRPRPMAKSKAMRALERKHRLAAMLNPIRQSNQHRL